MTNSCVICGDDEIKEGETISCFNDSCDCIMCTECTTNYLQLCKNERKVPSCVNTGCTGEILVSSLTKKIDIELYHQLLFDYVKVFYSNETSETVSKNVLLKRLKQDRLDFVEKSFPLAIKQVIKIAFKRQLIGIKNKQLSEAVRELNLKCFNLFCDGKLDSEYNCVYCNTTFCNECEVALSVNTKVPHTCKTEDIESLKFVSSLIKCPKCRLPIQRSYGCNQMTCTSCQTHFDYSTGKVINYGNNHNDPFHFKIKKSIATTYLEDRAVPDHTIYTFLKNFEDSKPSFNIKSFITALVSKTSGDLQLSRTYEAMKLYNLNIKRYYEKMALFEDNLKKNTLTRALLLKHF